MSSTVTKPLASSMAARAGPIPFTNVRGVLRSMWIVHAAESREMPMSPTVYNAFVKLLPLALFAAICADSADLRVGVIGTDTSHVPAFTQMLNSADGAKDHVPGARVVAAYKGGSK